MTLILGFLTRYPGGISYFSPRFGFVCDSVVNYEVGAGHAVDRDCLEANWLIRWSLLMEKP